MDRDKLLELLGNLLIEREKAANTLSNASIALWDADKAIDNLIDQLQPRIEVTKPEGIDDLTRGDRMAVALLGINATPSDRVLRELIRSNNRSLAVTDITQATNLNHNSVGCCLRILKQRGQAQKTEDGRWMRAT